MQKRVERASFFSLYTSFVRGVLGLSTLNVNVRLEGTVLGEPHESSRFDLFLFILASSKNEQFISNKRMFFGMISMHDINYNLLAVLRCVKIKE